MKKVVLMVVAAVSLRAAEPIRMEQVVRGYLADAESVRAFFDVPWAEPTVERQAALLKEWRGKLDGVDFKALDRGGQADFVVLKNDLERDLVHLDRRLERIAAIGELIPFRTNIAALELARWRGERVDPARAAGEVEAIGKAAKELKEAARKQEVREQKSEVSTNQTEVSKDKKDEKKKISVEPINGLRAAKAVEGLRGSLKRWFEFHNGYQPEFSWWVKASYEEAAKGLEEYAKHLREEVAGQKGKEEDPLLGEPIGADELAMELRFEMIAYSADEVIALGERELAWCEAEFKKAAAEMGFTNDWKAAMAKLRLDFVPPGQQDKLVSEIAADALAFVKAKDFVSVPALCEETWRMKMIAPDLLKTIPYAAYGGQEMMVAYPRDDMKQEDKLMVMRGNNRHFTRLTVPHELIPGHHLQQFVAARSHDYRRNFATPFYVEGWALYCELRLWELGWARSPEERIGMLFWRAHRAARIITTVKFQLGQMKPEEMVQFLMDRVGHEKFGATSEVRRFIADETAPLYQAGYLIGGRQLHVLRGEMSAAKKFSERAFNDAVLEQGSLPIELLRAVLRNQPIARDGKPVWKF